MQKLLSRFRPHLLSALLIIGVLLLIRDTGILSPGIWLIILVAVLLLVFSRRPRCEGFVSWKPEYSVGIQSIDEQHIKLLNLINNVRAAVLCDTGPDFERGALEDLVAYTQGHLKYEEELMREHEYFDFEAHKGQHDRMVSQVDLYVKRYDEQGGEILPEVADYLQRWLMQHIQGTDRKLCDFLRTREGH
ncbi:MAG: bacteriohemerythrin [Candidatus Thiodiazotropha sp.]